MDLWRAALPKRDGRSQAEAAVETGGGGSEGQTESEAKEAQRKR